MRKIAIVLLLGLLVWLVLHESNKSIVPQPRHGFIRSGPSEPTETSPGVSNPRAGSSPAGTVPRDAGPKPLSDELPKIRVHGS